MPSFSAKCFPDARVFFQLSSANDKQSFSISLELTIIAGKSGFRRLVITPRVRQACRDNRKRHQPLHLINVSDSISSTLHTLILAHCQMSEESWITELSLYEEFPPQQPPSCFLISLPSAFKKILPSDPLEDSAKLVLPSNSFFLASQMLAWLFSYIYFYRVSQIISYFEFRLLTLGC